MVDEEVVEDVEEKSGLDIILESDYHLVDGIKMVPLRLIAEELGYEVHSTGKGAIVRKGVISYTIVRGEKTYGYNKSLKEFINAPKLIEENKTYVSEDFVKELLKLES